MVSWFTEWVRQIVEDGHVGMKHRIGRGLRTPAFGIVVLTPILLAGAVAASPGHTAVPANSNDVTPLASVQPPQPESHGVAVVAMARPPADFRFAANTVYSPPPPPAVVSAVGGMRIPAMALSAYRKAEQTMAAAAPGCGVSWNLLAGIGRIESSHANGGATDARGTAVRPIYGPALDGTLPGNEVIVQSNMGGRANYAHALGPMQFLPGTWSRYASDGDGDGRADPQNLFDATLSAARYLCSDGLNLRNQAQVLTAILRYNNSMAYAQNVLGWAAAYATGVAPVDLPAITGPVPALAVTAVQSRQHRAGRPDGHARAGCRSGRCAQRAARAWLPGDLHCLAAPARGRDAGPAAVDDADGAGALDDAAYRGRTRGGCTAAGTSAGTRRARTSAGTRRAGA
jgi:membrane-bound lytic murein transglycosylase B